MTEEVGKDTFLGPEENDPVFFTFERLVFLRFVSWSSGPLTVWGGTGRTLPAEDLISYVLITGIPGRLVVKKCQYVCKSWLTWIDYKHPTRCVTHVFWFGALSFFLAVVCFM